MRKTIAVLVWAFLFCFLVASPSFAADEKQGTSEKTEWRKKAAGEKQGTTGKVEWQKKKEDFQKKREQRLQELKKEKETSNAQAGQKQEEQEREKKETHDENKGGEE
jgi:hypothetical protein